MNLDINAPDVKFYRRVLAAALHTGERNGQALFNLLPNDIAQVVSNTSFDPFGETLSMPEVHAWIDQHLIFQDGQVVGLFNEDAILYPKET